MKKRATFYQTLKSILALTLLAYLFPLEVRSQGTVTFSKPQNVMYYEHDGSNWIHLKNYENTYNAAGSMLTQITKDAVTNQNLLKRESNYDSQERDTMTISYKWQNNSWVLTGGGKTLYQYNSANKITQRIFRNLQNGNWVNSTKIDYTYNPDGSKADEITYQKDGNNGWSATNKKRTVYFYVNGIQTEYITYNFQAFTSSWIPSQKRTYAGWHTAYLPIATVDQIAGSNGAWNNQGRSTFTLLPNNGYIQYIEEFKNGNWVPNWRDRFEYNTQKHLSRLVQEDNSSGSWITLNDRDILWTYSAQNDILEKIEIYNDSTGTPKRLQTKEVNGNFQYFTRVLGSTEIQNKQPDLTVYPNPFYNKIQIESGGQKLQDLTATISDLTGKTWKTQNFKASETKQLNLEFLPKGIYLLHLQTEKGKTVRKIVKN